MQGRLPLVPAFRAWLGWVGLCQPSQYCNPRPAADEQLYKDVEGCLEACQDGLAAAAKWAAEQDGAGPGGNGSTMLGDLTLLQVRTAV